MATIQAILLDLGNVVLELDFGRLLRAFEIDPTAASNDNPFDHWEDYDRYERGQMDDSTFFERLKSRVNLPELDTTDCERRWNQIFVGEVKGVDKLLADAPLPLFALTNANPVHIRFAEAHFPVLARFKRLFTSYDLGSRKPEREIYLRALSEIRLPAKDVLFIDDREENVIAARELGFEAHQCRVDGERLQQIFTATCY